MYVHFICMDICVWSLFAFADESWMHFADDVDLCKTLKASLPFNHSRNHFAFWWQIKFSNLHLEQNSSSAFPCHNETLGPWWKGNKEGKVWSTQTVQSKTKPCMTCQTCQLIFVSKAHYSITLQLIAYSSVFFNSSHTSLHLLSPKCQHWMGSVNWQMSVTNVNCCLSIRGR